MQHILSVPKCVYTGENKCNHVYRSVPKPILCTYMYNVVIDIYNFRVKIVDDDVDFDSLLPGNIENTLEDDVGDNEPTVAEFVDERPDHVIQMERYREDSRWKTLGHGKYTALSFSRNIIFQLRLKIL